MNAVTGEVPRREPMVIVIASTQYANVDPSKSCVTGSRRSANFAIEYKVLLERLGKRSKRTSENKLYPVVSRRVEGQEWLRNILETYSPRIST